MKHGLCAVLFLTLVGWALGAGAVTVELLAPGSIAPGDTAEVALKLVHANGWHTYAEHPGETGLPTSIDWQLPHGWSAGAIRWPAAVEKNLGGIKSNVYEGTVYLKVPVTAPKDAKFGEVAALMAKVKWLSCSETMCVPGAADLVAELPVAPQTVKLAVPMAVAKPEVPSVTLGLVAMAFVGGLILNLMPCVFPVLGIKILSFVKQGGQSRAAVIAQGVAHALGIVASILTLGVVLLGLKAAGASLGWGFQLQNPIFVWVMVVVMGALTMSLGGVWEMPSLCGCSGGKAAQAGGLAGSFFSGALMAAMATPCSAPFLAPALGTVFVLPMAQAMAVLTCVALGMAAPYLVLTLWPNLVARLPKPGAWMETFKNILAWPMAGAVVYLLWVLTGQVEGGALLTILLSLVAAAAGVWALAKFKGRGAKMVGALLLLGGLWGSFPQVASDLKWEAWSPERVAQLRSEGRWVYIDFTARWCATCQLNKAVVFHDAAVVKALKEKNVALLKADWTNADPRITAELAKWGRAAVPFVLVYKGSAEAVALPEALTAERVLGALEGKVEAVAPKPEECKMGCCGEK